MRIYYAYIDAHPLVLNILLQLFSLYGLVGLDGFDLFSLIQQSHVHGSAARPTNSFKPPLMFSKSSVAITSLLLITLIPIIKLHYCLQFSASAFAPLK